MYNRSSGLVLYTSLVYSVYTHACTEYSYRNTRNFCTSVYFGRTEVGGGWRLAAGGWRLAAGGHVVYTNILVHTNTIILVHNHV